MTKPADIPQDVWETSAALAKFALSCPFTGSGAIERIGTKIARAIMAGCDRRSLSCGGCCPRLGSGGGVMSDDISPWDPEQDKIRLAVLSKLIEECNELSGRAARCIAQGVDEIDPDSGRTNREEMTREVSDVIACIQKLNGEMDIGGDADRVNRKFLGYGRWHGMIRGEQP